MTIIFQRTIYHLAEYSLEDALGIIVYNSAEACFLSDKLNHIVSYIAQYNILQSCEDKFKYSCNIYVINHDNYMDVSNKHLKTD
jgi:hypothetical protein